MLFLILLISGLSLGVYSDIVTGPSNTVAKVGDTVLLPCMTDRKTCSDVDWAKQEGIQSSVAIFKSDSGMLNSKQYPLERYNVSSVDGCNLKIRDLKLTDSGLFSCSEAKDSSAMSRYAILAVVEHDCKTNAGNDIIKGAVYNNTCSAKFNSSLIKPLKIELSVSGVNPPAHVQSTDADTVVLSYAGEARPPYVPEYNCALSLLAEQSSPETHAKNTHDLLPPCTLLRRQVIYPVSEINCNSGKKEVQKSETVECKADGYPLPTCECKSDKAEETWNCSKFTIPETAVLDDTYICIARNTVSGQVSTATTTLTVTTGSNNTGSSAPVGMIVGVVMGVVVVSSITAVGVFLFKKYKLGKQDRNSESAHPLKNTAAESAPPKPPRANSNQVDRPRSDVQYAHLAKEENPHVRPNNRMNPPSTTIYASVNNA